MVLQEINQKGQIVFRCENCKLLYSEKKRAAECEKFCHDNKACDSDLIKKAVE